ncbi:ATP-dependent nuclease [Clostridium estertheticum]|uniref:AAA family ATPase n=1 Tax=Clostridium estertheticum TaxID=238834 RepID=A0AA47ELF7_9CLOT|nr:AAA family ATPase [Clostridium estertheticum]MBU3154480.1 AAA family ATPase [Clostridium estertheticum]WAG62081.1 AAA family ATPase [Clostridium estertheticum]
MYLKSVLLENFRKFRYKNNIIEFVSAEDYKKDASINIAPKTTLIIGKNNSGKTTVIDALNKLINNVAFKATDFNFDYLKELSNLYTIEYLDSEDLKLPTLKFIVTVGIDNGKEDILTNIIPFMSLEDTEKSEIDIIIGWEIIDRELFIKAVKEFIPKNFKNQKFDRFLELIDKTDFEISYYNTNKDKKKNFNLKKLIELTPIRANNVNSEDCLSDAFCKIIDYRYANVIDPQIVNELDKQIVDINDSLTRDISTQHTNNINSSLSKMILGEKCQILLKSDLNFQKLIKNVLKYEYVEGKNNIPERQFGLGYTNLMMIIAEIITYMEKYPETSFNSQINLISIEEPETFMHPQMQEQFIKNINEMITSLLENNNKHVNSQIIIITHSAHILNSKIHEGNTFNNINYITSIDNCAKSECLNDNVMIDLPKNPKNNKERWKREQKLKFLKKHIKFRVSELFFADAAIFVEGITEYTLLQHYLDIDLCFSKYYISVILVDGAHAKVYENLIHALSIPSLIVTDIDIKREKLEKGEKDIKSPGQKPLYLQMGTDELKGRETTNSTLSHFYKSKNAEFIINGDYKHVDNLMVICQKDPIETYYPTSFEESFILTNLKNNIVNNALKKVKPDIYKDIIKNGGIVKNSFKLQKKLSDSKSDFANELLYEILICDDKTLIPILPKYINDGLLFLQDRLRGN